MAELEESNDLEAMSGLEIEAHNDSDSSDCCGEVYPMTEIRIDKVQYSVLHLYNLVIKRDQLVIDPEFQRNEVWSSRQKCELIESILMGIPIPVIYLFESKEGKRQVVDGRQRIMAIIDYYNNKFALRDLKILRGAKYQNCSFEKLDAKSQALFEDYQLSFYIIQPPTPERVKYDIFDRVNRGGTRLNNQEMRNALYHGRSTKLLKYLARTPEFLAATERSISDKRMKGRYIILRLLSFFLLRNGGFKDNAVMYRSDLEDFLAKSMTYMNERMAKEDMVRLARLFRTAMRKIGSAIGPDAFRFSPRALGDAQTTAQRRPINMLLFEALGYMFMYAEEKDIDISALDFGHIKDVFETSPCFDGKNDSAKRIDERYELITKQLMQQ